MASSSLPLLNSYSTALVLLPPSSIQSRINPLRSANDRSFPRWTSHLTLLFPFVEPSSLPTACSVIRDALSRANISPFSFKLDKVDMFRQREYDTVYLGPSHAREVHRLWDTLSAALGYSGRSFVPHLTLGQAYHQDRSLAFLQDKGKLLLDQAIQWDVCHVVVLRKAEVEGGVMNIYEKISLLTTSDISSEATVTGLLPAIYRFGLGGWTSQMPVTSQSRAVTLATYNVLSDPNHPTSIRSPRLLSTLLAMRPVPDVLCLQKMTDELLRYLLADPGIRACWPYSTHDPTSVLPSERNIVFLAREAFGFISEFVQLRKHKPAVVLQLPRVDAEPLVIVGIHLTAGLESFQCRTRLNELGVLLTFLKQRFPASPWVVMGDFNIPTSQAIPTSVNDSFHDAWLTIYGSEDGGATYDPRSNTLAAQTVRADPSPQRYDRIWVRCNMEVEVNAVKMFGRGDGEASGHYGLIASISFAGVDTGQRLPTPVTSSRRDLFEVVGSGKTASDEELEEVVRHRGGLPTTTQQAERARIPAILRAVLSIPARPAVDTSQILEPRPPSVVRFEFVPVGSFALGVDTQDSDMDILVVGNIPPRTFWSLARVLLRKSASGSQTYNGGNEESIPTVILKRFVRDASVPMMELVVGTVHIDLQYCAASKLLDSWSQAHALPPSDSAFLLPAPSLRTLNAYRNLLTVLRVLPVTSLPAFRLAHRALKLFCVSWGIYSSRLGYLGGIHLTLLLARTTVLHSPNPSAAQLLHAFFTMYVEWDWAHDAVAIPGVNDATTYVRAVKREPMVILSLERPVLNVVQNANEHTLNAIVSSFKRAHQQMAAGTPWADICGFGGICGNIFNTAFLPAHQSYIKLELLFWGSSATKARAWIGYVESRLPHLLVLLQTSFPSWNVQLWPTRLIDADNPGDSVTGTQSLYLLGLDAPTEYTSAKNIQSSLLTFENQLRRNERFYDPTEMFVSVSNVAPSQLPEHITTPPTWPNDGIDPDDTSDEETAEELSNADPDAAFSPISSKQIKRNRPRQMRGRDVPHSPAPKLRTSSDVYHRILWDRELNSEDYLIGYEDRFSGLQEMALTNWKRDVEDEDFVPFHRVIHFRRKSDGILIWDRRNKIDLVFGSGIQRGSSSSS